MEIRLVAFASFGVLVFLAAFGFSAVTGFALPIENLHFVAVPLSLALAFSVRAFQRRAKQPPWN